MNRPHHGARTADAAPSRSRTLRVLVADAHPVVSEGLTRILQTQPDMEVTAVARSGAEAIRLWRSLIPDLGLLEIRLPDIDGVDLVRHLDPRQSKAALIMFTARETEESIYRCFEAGARCFLPKTIEPDCLISVLRRVAGGETVLLPGQSGLLAGQLTRSALTSRETEVLDHVAAGLANKEIAACLGIGIGTVKTHVKSVFEKLGTLSRTEAVLVARRRGLISD